MPRKRKTNPPVSARVARGDDHRGDEARWGLARYLRVVAIERDLPRSHGERPPPASHAYPAYPAGPSPAARPPLDSRLTNRRWVAIDFAVAGLVALFELAVMRHAFIVVGHRAWVPAALLAAVAVFAPMALRRRAPTMALGALLVLVLLLERTAPSIIAVIFLATAYVLYMVTVSGSRRTGAAALGLVLVAMLIVATTGQRNPGAIEAALVPLALANIIAWMTGYSVRQRRLYVVRLQHQAASSAVAEERLRIARELHDVVAHSMSVIAVQAGYGQYVMDMSPDGARDALGAIQATSRDALEEMRRMLGVLRQQDTAPAALRADSLCTGNGASARGASALGASALGASALGDASAGMGRLPAGAATGRGPAPLAPAPGLADLERLVQRTSGAGVQVRLEISGQARPVPAGIDLSAYRIIQEALTNVVKHAGTGASCPVEVRYGAASIDIAVTDDGARAAALPRYGAPVAGPRGVATASVPGIAGTAWDPSAAVAGAVARSGVPGLADIVTAGAGHGIIGMRERAGLCGGEFTVGPLVDGGYRVSATLPLPASDRNGIRIA